MTHLLLALFALLPACDVEPAPEVSARDADVEQRPLLLEIEGVGVIEIKELVIRTSVVEELEEYGELPSSVSPSDGPDDISFVADARAALILPAVTAVREAARRTKIHVPVDGGDLASVVVTLDVDYGTAVSRIGDEVRVSAVAPEATQDVSPQRDQPQTAPYHSWVMRDVLVSSYDVSGSPVSCLDANAASLDSMRLNYNRIEWETRAFELELTPGCTDRLGRYQDAYGAIDRLDVVFESEEGQVVVAHHLPKGFIELRRNGVAARARSIEIAG